MTPNPAVTVASNKLAKAQEVTTARGLREAVPLYIEAADALATEKRFDAAAGVLLDLLNVREKKRGLFGSKEVNPLGSERVHVAKRFAGATRSAAVNDSILELLGTLAAEYPDEAPIRLANAQALYRAAYVADAIDEYRYCEQLQPQDGHLSARLGELYALMSRNKEAVENLQRGIGRLREQQNFEDFAAFCLKLIEAAPDSANDVCGWLQELPDDVFIAQRNDLTRTVDAVRERGADDGRWSAVEARLASLPEELPQTAYSDQSEIESLAGWNDGSIFEPASEDEMRMLLGPTAAAADAATRNNNGVSHQIEDDEYQQDESTTTVAEGFHISAGRAQATSELDEADTPAEPESVSAPPAREPATAPPGPKPATTQAPGAPERAAQPASAPAAALPPGLAAYTRRKADGLLAAGDYEAAAHCYERLLKAGFELEIAQRLLECYVNLSRSDAASTLGLQLADLYEAAGQTDKALETLAKVLEHTTNVQVEQRRSELLAGAKG